MLENEELGKVLTFRTTFGHVGPEHWGVNKRNSTWFFKHNRSAPGVGGDLGIHNIDLVQYLLGVEIEQVSAFQGALDKVDENGKPIEVCDNIVCNLKTKRGQIGTASFSWMYYDEEVNSTIFYCEKGIMKIYHSDEYQIEVITKDGERVKYQIECIQTNDDQTSSGVIDAFVESVRLDKEPLVLGEDALSSLKVILAILKAAETRL